MKTDIQIAQEAVMLPITEVAAGIGVSADDLELYGKYKAKSAMNTLKKLKTTKTVSLSWLLLLIQHRPVRERQQLQ